MEQETKTFLEQFEKQVFGVIGAMEKRLEDKIDSYMERNQESNKEIKNRHADFRADIKQLYGRVELIEKSDVALESRVKNIEEDKKESKETSRFRWEYFVMFGSMVIAAIALFYGG